MPADAAAGPPRPRECRTARACVRAAGLGQSRIDGRRRRPQGRTARGRRALAEADELHRHAELALHRDDDAALGRAVELGEHDAGDVDRLAEDLGLAQAVLAGGGVEDQQHLVDRRLLLDDALDLAELVHEADLVVQAARGVDEHDIGLHLGPGLDGVEGHRGRVGAVAVRADRRHADPPAPGLELVGGGGAEGVGGAEHDVLVLGDEDAGELADGGGLAGAVDADHEHDGRAALGARGRWSGPWPGRPARAGPRAARRARWPRRSCPRPSPGSAASRRARSSPPRRGRRPAGCPRRPPTPARRDRRARAGRAGPGRGRCSSARDGRAAAQPPGGCSGRSRVGRGLGLREELGLGRRRQGVDAGGVLDGAFRARPSGRRRHHPRPEAPPGRGAGPREVLGAASAATQEPEARSTEDDEDADGNGDVLPELIDHARHPLRVRRRTRHRRRCAVETAAAACGTPRPRGRPGARRPWCGRRALASARVGVPPRDRRAWRRGRLASRRVPAGSLVRGQLGLADGVAGAGRGRARLPSRPVPTPARVVGLALATDSVTRSFVAVRTSPVLSRASCVRSPCRSRPPRHGA